MANKNMCPVCGNDLELHTMTRRISYNRFASEVLFDHYACKGCGVMFVIDIVDALKKRKMSDVKGKEE